MIPHLGQVANVFSPSDSDWVVSIVYSDGTVRHRRMTPGTITEEQAVGYAIAADARPISDAVRIECRRASDRKVEITGADTFIHRMRRICKWSG
jgi:hypothetical protein